MKTYLFIILTVAFALNISPDLVQASGISVDAGLTPSEDRWIFRLQTRYMQSTAQAPGMNSEMTMYVVPVVAVYGLRNYLTLMARQTIVSRKMSMSGSSGRENGFGDFFFLLKYKAFRVNTPDYTLGISPTIGISVPTGKQAFTSETWDLRMGVYVSGRRGRWATDLNIAYRPNGVAGDRADNIETGDEFSADWAGAYQFSYNSTSETTLTPVLELSFSRVMPNTLSGIEVPNSGEKLFYVSPGAKISTSSVIGETLIRIPVWQNQVGVQLEKEIGFIAGIRLLF